ncbi:hypothetical protein SFRURICE_015486 [Spodoptera frugiperda]|nr:hypothetical protein SFRURICE_015486 [Spodoptera frugiperda]
MGLTTQIVKSGGYCTVALRAVMCRCTSACSFEEKRFGVPRIHTQTRQGELEGICSPGDTGHNSRLRANIEKFLKNLKSSGILCPTRELNPRPLEGTFERQSKYNNINIDQEGTFERQSKYNNINNVCLSISPLVKLFARSKGTYYVQRHCIYALNIRVYDERRSSNSCICLA